MRSGCPRGGERERGGGFFRAAGKTRRLFFGALLRVGGEGRRGDFPRSAAGDVLLRERAAKRRERKTQKKGRRFVRRSSFLFSFSLYALYATGVPCAAERQRGASQRRGRNAGVACAERVNFAAAARGVCAVLPEFHTEAAGKSGKSVRRTAVFFTKGKTAERPAGRGGRGFRRERPGRRSLQCFYKVDGKNTFSRV